MDSHEKRDLERQELEVKKKKKIQIKFFQRLKTKRE